MSKEIIELLEQYSIIFKKDRIGKFKDGDKYVSLDALDSMGIFDKMRLNEKDKGEVEQKYIKRFIKIYNSFTFHANNEAYSTAFEVMLIDLLNELGFKELTKTVKNIE